MAQWIQDPQNRPEVEKVTERLKLPVWQPWYKGKFREFWNESWGKIDDALSVLNKNEIEQLLGFNALSNEFVLATLDDIRNLFPGAGGSTEAFNLAHISSDSTRIVNMLLLSNYNEYLQQKLNEIKNYINDTKVNKVDLNNYYTVVKTNELLNTKVNNTTRISVGDGLLGSGTLNNNINITVDTLNTSEIQQILRNWR